MIKNKLYVDGQPLAEDMCTEDEEETPKSTAVGDPTTPTVSFDPKPCLEIKRKRGKDEETPSPHKNWKTSQENTPRIFLITVSR